MPHDPRYPLSVTTVCITLAALMFWTVAALAAVAMGKGTPDAGEAVAACTLGATLMTATAVSLARLDRKYGP